MPKFSSIANHFPDYKKYLQHDSTKKCVDGLYKAQEKEGAHKKEKGIVLVHFLKKAVHSSHLSDSLLVSLIEKGLKKLQDKKNEQKLTEAVFRRFQTVKNDYEQKKPPLPQQAKPAQAQQIKKDEKAAQELQKALEKMQKEEEERQLLLEQQREEELNRTRAFVRQERLYQAAWIPQQTDQEAKHTFSELLLQSAIVSKDEIIQQGAYKKEDLACMMGDELNALMDKAISKLLENSVEVAGELYIFSPGNDKKMKLPTNETFKDFQPKLLALFRLYETLTSKQRALLEKLLLHKAEDEALRNQDPKVKQAFLAFTPQRLDLLQTFFNANPIFTPLFAE